MTPAEIRATQRRAAKLRKGYLAPGSSKRKLVDAVTFANACAFVGPPAGAHTPAIEQWAKRWSSYFSRAS